jgi:hypothetical protein
MSHYYIAYMLDDQGNILGSEEIEAGDDASAIGSGRQLAGTHSAAQGVELWHGRRLVFSSHPRLG